MKKSLQSLKVLLAVLFVVLGASASAQSNAIYESYVILSINGGLNAYYDMGVATPNPDFQGATLGQFTLGQSLVLKGGQNKTVKCNSGDTTGGNLYYRVYLTSATPSGTFTSLPMNFLSDDPGAGPGCQNQSWQGTGGTANLLTGLAAGNYTVEVYSDAPGSPGTAFASNGGANYKATFTVNPITVTSTTGTSSPIASYGTVAAAVTAINTAGIHTGTVVCSVPAGYTETAPAGGYAITASGSAGNTITFVKNGAGANPTFTAFTPQASGSIVDAVFKIVGGDYITIDGFTLQENASNTTTTVGSNNMTEFGVALLYATSTNGAQFNTIQNCTISLNKTYTNTFGIYSNTTHTATSGTVTAEATSSAGANSNNKVYSNNISNTNYGIFFTGSGTIAASIDIGNDIGGNVAVTANTISNLGGLIAASGYSKLSATSYAAITMNQQINDNVSYNSINTGLVSSPVTVYGILKFYGVLAPTTGTITSTINNNTVTIADAPTTATTGGIVAISSQGLTPLLSTATISINNNTVQNSVLSGSTATTTTFACISNSSLPGTLNIVGNNILNNSYTATSATTGQFQGIINSGAAGTINLNSNIIRGSIINTNTTATGPFFGIVNSGAVVTAINMNSNQMGNASGNALTFSLAATNSVLAINNQGGASTAVLTITGNDVRGITHSVAGSSSHTYILNSSATFSQNISSNTFTNLNVNTSGNVTFIANDVALSATGTCTVSNNSIVTAFNKGGAGGTVTGYLTTTAPSSAVGAVKNEQNNNFSNGTVTGTTIVNLWTDLEGAPGPSKNITGNTFSSWSLGSGVFTGIQTNYSGNGSNVSNNLISNVTGSGAMTGVLIGTSNGGAAQTISGNTISSLVSSGGLVLGITSGTSSVTALNVSGNNINGLSSTITGATRGLNFTAGATLNIFKNKIYNISGSNAGSIISGIGISSATTANVYNNIIGDLRSTAGTQTAPAESVIGLNFAQTLGTINAHYNTVYLNASSSGANFSTSALYTNTGATLISRNNNLVNLSTSSGTGKTVAYRRSSSTLTSYSTTSNNNNLFAANLYFDGTTPQTTLAGYKTVMSTRDQEAVSESPTFVSTLGSDPTYLHINTTTPTSLESGGIPVAGVTDDFDGDVRNTSTPDIGADEFTGVPLTPVITLSTNDIPAGNIVAGTNSAPIYSFAIGVTTNSAKLTGLTATTTGTYLSADVTNLKVYYQTSAIFNSATATLLSTLTTPGVAGSKTFSSFTAQSIAAGSTGYIFITADIPCGAIATNTIAVNAITATNTTFASGTATGTPAAGNLQTITVASPNNVTLPAASVANASSVITWTNPTGCYNEIMIVAATASNTGTPTGDGTAYTANLAYASGTGLGNGFVVYKGSTSPQTVTALTNGTGYYYKIFTRNGTVWSAGAEVSATPSLYCIPVSATSTYYINNFATTGGISNITNSSSGYSGTGYGNFTSQSVSQNAGSPINFTASFGASGTYTFGFAIWVDFDDNGVFTGAERLYVSPGYSSSYSNSFVVPIGAPVGNHRMRILADYNNSVPSNPCVFNSNNGEAEDYILNVIATIVPTITSLGSTSGCVGSSITINGTGLSGATAANVKIGGTAVTSITSNSGTVLVAVIGNGTTGTVSVTTAGGTATSAATFTVNPAPTVSWAVKTADVCQDALATTTTLPYTATTDSPISYSIAWNASPANSFVAVNDQANTFNFGAGSITINVPAGTAAGTYTGTITAKNANGCVTLGTQTFTLKVNPKPTSTASNTGPYCVGSTIQLTSGSSGNSNYAWTGPNGYSLSGAGGVGVNENFDGSIPGWTYTADPFTSTSSSCSGNYSLLFTGLGQYGISPMLTNPQILSCSYRTSTNTNAWSVNIQISDVTATSQTSGPWITVGMISAPTGNITNCTPITPINLSAYPGTRYVRFIDTRGTGTAQRGIDDVVISVSSAQNPTIPNATTSMGGTYTLTVTSSDGCTATATTVVAIDTPTVAGTASSDQELCSGSTPTALTLAGKTGAVVKWQSATDSGFTLGVTDIANTTTTLTLGAATTTTYYRAVVQNGSCLVLNSNVIEIKVNPLPSAITSITETTLSEGAATACDQDYVKLEANGGVLFTPSTLLSEDFTSVTTIPAGWATQLADPKTTWSGNSSVLAGGTANEMRLNALSSAAADNGIYGLSSTVINATGKYNISLSFKSYLSTYSFAAYPFAIKIQSSFDGSTWTDRWVYTPIANGVLPAQTINVDLSSALDDQPAVYLRFALVGKPFGLNNWYVDDVVVTGKLKNSQVIWSPITGLFNDALLSVVYTGDIRSIVYAASNNPQVYTATAGSVSGCQRTANSTAVSLTKKVFTGLAPLPADQVLWNVPENWTNKQIPTITKCVIIPSGKNVLVNIPDAVTKNVTVDAGGKLTINAAQTLTVKETFTNNAAVGDVMIESDGNLIQVDNGTNVKPISARRVITIKDNTQYNYLISPLIGTNLKTAIYESVTTPNAPLTLYHNEANNKFYSSSGAYILGRGLAVKEPGSGTIVNALFTGVPMNGSFAYPLANSNVGAATDLGYNLTGNPYPSNIDLIQLYNLPAVPSPNPTDKNSNNINATFYFWDNSANASGTAQQGSTYNGSSYAIYNVTAGNAGTGLPAGTLSGTTLQDKTPTNVVKVGQAFMVKSAEQVYKKLYFDNTIRVGDGGKGFFGNPTKQGTPLVDDRYRLKFAAPSNITTELAVVYFDAGTNDFAKDDSQMNGSPSDILYTIIGDQKAVINGRSTFVNTDVIPLGSNHFSTGNYTISLGTKEGIFDNGQNIYLKDKQTGIMTNLSAGSYTFAANAGESTGRFDIVYQPETVLATEGTVKENLIVYRDGSDFVVKAKSKKITSLEVFDTAGRLILTLNPNSIKAVIPAEKIVNGVYVLKINQNGQITSKKIIR
ncbi:T9SS type A sorting domain-containing protein [Kaistella sp. G5-32]|uniref:T9SS type A sorting domain-containing protein n=1 Tax=Kaistella gelatinilytica TaxID=2787636 RepID=A0ABS0FBY3_9FLAO|nr:GEVED domain-containing protein [Kaistella gelatinilytica]MBF8457224.1 T9SS type A sorting domain-containing protein [Kaistella gelatinilytica]